MRMRLLLALAIVAGFAASGERVLACSCGQSRPSCQATWEASAVFVGEVVNVQIVEPPSGYDPLTGPFLPTRVSLKVVEKFRGEIGQTVDVSTGTGNSDCGYTFAARTSYLVYAYATSLGQLAATVCSRTRQVDQAAADLAYLRGPARQPSGLGSIEGIARHRDPDEDGLHFDAGTPFPGGRVTFEALDPGRTGRFQATTGPDGRYAVRAPVGTYRATMAVREGLYTTAFGSAEILDTRGCANVDFIVQSDGRISGRVFDAEGRAVPALSIDILTAQEANESYFNASDRARTDASGFFEFTRLAPASYAIGLTLRREFSAAESRAVWFTEPSGTPSTPVIVGPEQRVWMGDLHLPASLKLASTTGVVLGADGAPLGGARVYAFISPGYQLAGGPIVVEAKGAFSFTVIAGRSYRFTAESADRRSIVESAPFTASATTQPVTVRFKKQVY